MMKSFVWIPVAVSVLLLFACTEAPSTNDIDVYENASNVSRVVLNKEAAVQVSYLVTLPYPDDSVIKFYRANLTRAGWVWCDPKGKWQEIFKVTESQKVGVRQIIEYAVHRESNRLMMLNLQYRSLNNPLSEKNLVWQIDTQYVTLVVYKIEYMKETLAKLQIECN